MQGTRHLGVGWCVLLYVALLHFVAVGFMFPLMPGGWAVAAFNRLLVVFVLLRIAIKWWHSSDTDYKADIGWIVYLLLLISSLFWVLPLLLYVVELRRI